METIFRYRRFAVRISFIRCHPITLIVCLIQDVRNNRSPPVKLSDRIIGPSEFGDRNPGRSHVQCKYHKGNVEDANKIFTQALSYDVNICKIVDVPDDQPLYMSNS